MVCGKYMEEMKNVTERRGKYAICYRFRHFSAVWLESVD